SGTSESVTGLVEATAYYFRVRAVNGGGTSPNSPTGSVTTGVDEPGTPPVVDPIPRLLAAAGGELEYTVTATETNGDAVTFACTSAVDEATWAVDTNGYFLFYPTTNEIGAALFAFTATDKDGESSPVAMTVTVNSVAATNAFEEWLEGQWQDPGDTNFQEEADYDADGATTFEEYVADTDPAASNAVLVLEGERVDGSGSGAVRLAFPSSTGRYYQLVYATSLFSSATVSNLGPGVGGTMVWTNETVGTWYGGIRAWLTEPPE
ncbi:MAG: hypothetical protein GX548_00790, partial [Lentisphaerae bacterium]|nr:hypothetical protein [Lentisphaerota bacterium]